MERILVIEDEEKIARFIELELQYEGYEVEKAFDGRDGLELLKTRLFDLVLLDVMLPGLNGIEVLRRLRHFSDVPVILLTARDTVIDKVTGLDGGADDYVTKPFAIEEVLARIRALLRKKKAESADFKGDGSETTASAAPTSTQKTPSQKSSQPPSQLSKASAQQSPQSQQEPLLPKNASGTGPYAAYSNTINKVNSINKAKTPEEAELTAGPLRLSSVKREVRINEAPVELTKREFDLLEHLLINKNIVLTRETLLQKVWGYDFTGETNAVDVYIRYLRAKIEEPFSAKIIRTVRGVGYVIKDE